MLAMYYRFFHTG